MSRPRADDRTVGDPKRTRLPARKPTPRRPVRRGLARSLPSSWSVRLFVEPLEQRQLLSGIGVAGAEDPCVGPLALDVEPQYQVHQTPRLQPGDAPLVGTPAYAGTDQVDILWQTITIGAGDMDRFEVGFRAWLSAEPWQPAQLNPIVDVGTGTRIMHSATIEGLDWDADYEYQVVHLRAGETLATYQHRFHTRLQAGDPQPFQFVAYGDSAISPTAAEVLENFRHVQGQINQIDPDFAILLGDNIYDRGEHIEADGRFNPEANPEAAEWIAGHIDYFGIGNHDGPILGVGDRVSRELFSVPVPIAGVNAHASLPEGEITEFTFSWDYGNTHFVTLDTNAVELPGGAAGAARIDKLLDFVVTDLQASDAQWKIVYTHHPILGTEKPYDEPSGLYFQQMLPRLLETGVDLLLVGDSHTYSWTFPLTGFEDRNQNGVISADEVDVARDNDRVYEKGAGLVQVVAGVGGRSLRKDPYPDPYMAAAYSLDDRTGPIEYGFAELDVTPDRLTVTYISAETGQVVGDTNGNGLADDDEPFFARFQLVDSAVSRGDLDNSGGLNDVDIDLLCAALLSLDPDPRYDMNRDGQNDRLDYETMIQSVVGVPYGDANLDGVFNSKDLIQILATGKHENPSAGLAGWAEGDWNCDGEFTTADLVTALQQGTYRG